MKLNLPCSDIQHSEVESLTSYESVIDVGRFQSTDTIVSSVDQLQCVGDTLSQDLRELGSQEGMDREWERWLCIHERTDSESVNIYIFFLLLFLFYFFNLQIIFLLACIPRY